MFYLKGPVLSLLFFFLPRVFVMLWGRKCGNSCWVTIHGILPGMRGQVCRKGKRKHDILKQWHDSNTFRQQQNCGGWMSCLSAGLGKMAKVSRLMTLWVVALRFGRMWSWRFAHLFYFVNYLGIMHVFIVCWFAAKVLLYFFMISLSPQKEKWTHCPFLH